MAETDEETTRRFPCHEEPVSEVQLVPIQECGTMPERRYEHTLVSCPPSAVWGFGGVDCGGVCQRTVFKLNVARDSTTEDLRLRVTSDPLDASSATCPFGPFRRHTAVLWHDAMIFYGGVPPEDEDQGAEHFPEECVIKYDLKTGKWEKVTTSGDVPRFQELHSSVVHEGRMFMFGGLSASELYSLNLVSMRWETLPSAPDSRSAHSAVVCKDEEGEKCMLVFGGEDDNEDRYNDIMKYRFDTKTWTVVKTRGSQNPSPRRGHGAVAVADGQAMLVIGGVTDEDEPLTDVWQLDTRTMTWSSLVVPEEWGRRELAYVTPVVVSLEDHSSVLFVQAWEERNIPHCVAMRLPSLAGCDSARCLQNLGQLFDRGLFTTCASRCRGPRFGLTGRSLPRGQRSSLRCSPRV